MNPVHNRANCPCRACNRHRIRQHLLTLGYEEQEHRRESRIALGELRIDDRLPNALRLGEIDKRRRTQGIMEEEDDDQCV